MSNSFWTRLTRDREASILASMNAALLLALGLLLGDRFFSVANFQSMALQVSVFGFLALAMAFSMLTGGIDLSIVSNAALSSIAGALILSGKIVPIEGNEPILIGLAATTTVVVGVLCGLLNGTLVAKFSIPPILATLGTMIFFSGIGLAITNGQSIPVLVSGLSEFSALTLAGFPVLFVAVSSVYVMAGILLSRRRFGRMVYLLGESATSLTFSGVRTEKLTVGVYALVGGLVGLAALVMLATLNSARVGFGGSYLLQSILVVVLAGFDPDGGRGRIANLALAVVLLQVLQSAFSILQLSPFAKDLVWGGILLVVMIVGFVVRSPRWQVWRKTLSPRAPTPAGSARA